MNPFFQHELVRLTDAGVQLPKGEAWEGFCERLQAALESAGAPSEVENSLELQRYIGLVAHLKEVIFQIDRLGRWAFLNRAWTELTAFELSESLGEPFLNFMHPEDKVRYMNVLQYTMETEEDTLQGEFRFRCKKGEYFWVEMSNRITLDAEGVVVGVSGTLMDITERKRDQAVLSAINLRLRTLIENMQAGILMESEDRKIAVINERLCAMFGIPVEAALLVGSDSEELLEMCFALSENEARLKEQLSLIRSSERIQLDTEIPLKDGRVFSLDYIPMERSESVSGQLWQVHDITERKQAEDQLAKAAVDLEMKNWQLEEARDEALRLAGLKSEFLANMSHEIRTPMNGIIGMTDLLFHTPLSDEQMDYTRTIGSSAQTLLRLINDILDFSKIEAGKLELEKIPFDLQEMLDDLLAVLGVKAHKKGVDLAVFLAPEVPARLMGDPVRLRQVLSNLTDNALKFTEHGGVAIRVEQLEHTQSEVVLKISVKDTGIGLKPEVAAQLFQNFYQGDASTTRKYGGTGLGLAICKRLSELMGGEIGIDTCYGEGSTFWFTVRMQAVIAEDRIWMPEVGLHFYLLEFPPITGETLKEQLKAWGLEAECIWIQDGTTRYLKSEWARYKDNALLVYAGQSPELLNWLEQFKRELPLMRRVLARSLYDLSDSVQQEEATLPLPLRLAHLRALLNRQVIAKPKVSSESNLELSEPNPARVSSGEVLLLRILVAEDNLVNQRVAQALLRKIGLRAEIVNNGQEAVTALGVSAFDLVLMDCQMPEMDGFQATRLIRSQEAEGRRVPILAMTANAMEGDRERCLACGMDDYIAKPVTLEGLKTALRQWLPGEMLPF